MGKYKTLGTFFDRIFRNDLNSNFNDVDVDIKAVDTRVTNIITNNPQPSEVVDARGGEATLSARLSKVDTTLAGKSNVSNEKIVMNNDGSTDTEALADLANFGGASVLRRGFVIHHYNDAEMCVLDNVGENNVFFLLRNANNPIRRPDKPSDFNGSADFIRAQNRYNNNGTWQAVTVFELKQNGDLKWSNQGPNDNKGVKLVNAQPSSNGNFAFTLQNITRNEKILDLQYEEGKSALYITTNTGNRLDIAPSNAMVGMKLTATNGNMEIAAGTDPSTGATKLIQLLSPVYSKTTTGWAQMARFVSKPASATAPGERGDYFCDTQYLYVCQGSNSWVRVPVSTW